MAREEVLVISNLNFNLRIISGNSRFLCVAHSLKESYLSNRNLGISMILRVLEGLNCLVRNHSNITNTLRTGISISSFTHGSLTSKVRNINYTSKISTRRKTMKNKGRTVMRLSKLSETATERPLNSISNRISLNGSFNNSSLCP